MNLAKLVLEDLSGPEGGLNLYRRYLVSKVNELQNFCTLGELEDKWLLRFYEADKPWKAPKFFDPANHPDDLANLEELLGVQIVIWRQRQTGRLSYRAIVYDRSIFDAMAEARPERVTYVIVTDRPKQWLHRVCDGKIDYLSQAIAEKWHGRFTRPHNTKCWLERALFLLDLPSQTSHRHGRACASLSNFLFFGPGEYGDAFSGRPFLIVTPVRSGGNSKTVFFQLSRFVAQGDEMLPDEMLCVFPDGCFMAFADGKAPPPKSLANRRARNEPELPGVGSFKKPSKSDGGQEGTLTACFCQACGEASSFEKSMPRNGKQSSCKTKMPLEVLVEHLCFAENQEEIKEAVSSCCRLSTSAFDVESAAVPAEQRRGPAPGRHAMPLLSDRRPQADELGPYARHQPVMVGYYDWLMQESGERPAVFHDLFGNPGEGGQQDFVDRFLDRVRERRDACVEAKRRLLRPLFDEIEEKRRAHFAEASAARRSALDRLAGDEDMLCDELSRQLAAGRTVDALDELVDMRRVEMERSSESAWRCSLYGWMEQAAQKLERTFCVTGFNLESFDLPLLSSRMMVYAKSRGLPISMGRDGGSIRFMKIDRIVFTDLSRLTAAGSSLAGLARTCKLDCNKGIFPFAQFTSPDYLRQPRLPSDAAEWVSDLNPNASPSQAEVDEALRQFDAWNCSNVGDYCAEYLRLDCEVTLKCALRLNDEFSRMVGVHPVSYGLSTVASLSNAAVQLYLAKKKKPAVRFCNSSVVHSLLATTGLRGGLCMQLASFGGRPPDVADYVRQTEKLLDGASPALRDEVAPHLSDYGDDVERYLRACNAHLGPGGHPGDRVAALDVNSLYASAQGLYSNFFSEARRPRVQSAAAHGRPQAAALRAAATAAVQVLPLLPPLSARVDPQENQTFARARFGDGCVDTLRSPKRGNLNQPFSIVNNSFVWKWHRRALSAAAATAATAPTTTALTPSAASTARSKATRRAAASASAATTPTSSTSWSQPRKGSKGSRPISCRPPPETPRREGPALPVEIGKRLRWPATRVPGPTSCRASGTLTGKPSSPAAAPERTRRRPSRPWAPSATSAPPRGPAAGPLEARTGATV